MGSGSASIFQSVANKDIFDFTTGNSDIVSFSDFLILGAGSGTGRGLVLGRTAQAFFDGRIWNMWFASIGGKCIDAVYVDGIHVVNTAFDSSCTDAFYGQKALNTIQALNRIYGMTSSGISILEGSNNSLVCNHLDSSGAANDTTAAIILDVDAASAKLAGWRGGTQ